MKIDISLARAWSEVLQLDGGVKTVGLAPTVTFSHRSAALRGKGKDVSGRRWEVRRPTLTRAR